MLESVRVAALHRLTPRTQLLQELLRSPSIDPAELVSRLEPFNELTAQVLHEGRDGPDQVALVEAACGRLERVRGRGRGRNRGWSVGLESEGWSAGSPGRVIPG